MNEYFVAIPLEGMTAEHYKNLNKGLLKVLTHILGKGKVLESDRIMFLDKITDQKERAFVNETIKNMLNAPINVEQVKLNLANFGAMLKDSDVAVTKASGLTTGLYFEQMILNWPYIINKISQPNYDLLDDAELLKEIDAKNTLAKQHKDQYYGN